VTLDGQPVSAGVLAFYPEDKNLPVTAVRVRRGKFSAKAEAGPFVGKATVKFEGSIWEATGDLADKAVTLETLTPGDGKVVEVVIGEGGTPIKLDYRSR